MPDIALQSTWPLLLVPAVLLIAWWGYRNTTPQLESRARTPFVALRALAFVLLLAVLASPVLNRVRDEPLPPRVAVLVDESASMSTPDAGGRPRAAVAKDVVRAVQEELGGADVEIEVVPFAGEAAPPLTPDSYRQQERVPNGAATDVLGPLRQTTDRLAGQNLQAIVLVTDGRPTRGGLDAAGAAGLGRPVFVVGVGDTLPPSDLVIDRCEYGPIAYVESEATLQVRIENTGFRGRSSTLRLFQAGREVFQQAVQFERDSGRTRIDIPLRFDDPGRKQLRLVLEPLDGEITAQNNTREVRIEVLKSRLRVLFVAARPNWDVAFLARTLRDDPNVKLDLVHRNQAGRWVRSADGTAFQLPRTGQEMSQWDVVVLGDAGRGERPFLESVSAAVETGCGLLVLGGRESVYTDREAFGFLAKALPVERAAVRAPQFVVQRARLTPQGMLHPVSAALVTIADEGRVLDKLPPLLGRHVELEPKPGGATLIATEDETQPVLVAGRYGNGRTLALAAFPIWRWGFASDPALRTAQLELTAQMVRWLVQPQDVKRVRIATDKPVYESGEAVEFIAQVLDGQFQPMPEAEVRVEVRRAGAAGDAVGTLVLERKTDRPGEYGGELSALGPGEYEAHAIAEHLGATVGRDTTRFALETYSTEFVDVGQDVDFLRELAAHSGGRYASPADAAALAEVLPRAPLPVTLRSEIEIWNSRTLFVLFIGALTLEWLLRKRRGLL
jgi:uncharacterized membrane protein